MTGVQIAIIAMSVASIIISALSLRWSVQSLRKCRLAERRTNAAVERIRKLGGT